jgi:hypothetical protein
LVCGVFLLWNRVDCSSLGSAEQIDCYTKVAEKISTHDGIQAAVDFIVNEAARHSEWGIIHLVMHNLGHIAYAKTEENLEATLSYIPQEELEHAKDAFDGVYDGYFHGALQAFFLERKGSSFTDTLSVACPSYDASRRHVVLNENGEYGIVEKCLHAVGHGLMYALDNDIYRSVEYCKEIADIDYRYWCAVGVFMENAYLHYPEYGADAPRPYVKDDFMVSLCETFSEPEFYSACSTHVGRAYNFATGRRDFHGALDTCMKLSRGSEGCVWDFARDRLVSFFKDDLAGALEICESLSGSYDTVCLDALVEGVRRGSAGYVRAKEADAFCEQIRVTHAISCEKEARMQ